MHRPCVRCQQGRRVQRNTQQRQRFSNICRVGFHMVRCPQQEHCSGLQGLHCQAASHTAARVAVEIRRRGQTSQPQEQLQQPGQPPRACCFWRPQRRRLQLHQRKSHDCQAQQAHPPEGFHLVQVQSRRARAALPAKCRRHSEGKSGAGCQSMAPHSNVLIHMMSQCAAASCQIVARGSQQPRGVSRPHHGPLSLPLLLLCCC